MCLLKANVCTTLCSCLFAVMPDSAHGVGGISASEYYDKGNKNKRQGKLSDVLQEKASPWRDPAVEYLLESTKDWSDNGRQQGIREERKKKDGISKLKYFAFLSKH